MSYTNRMGDTGDTYYLHEGRTSTGKTRYFVAKAPREGVLSAMPDGFEFTESINGVVSVQKVDPAAAKIPDTHVALARAEVARHPHLRGHRIEVIKDEIVVFEPAAPPIPEWFTGDPGVASDQLRRRIRYNLSGPG